MKQHLPASVKNILTFILGFVLSERRRNFRASGRPIRSENLEQGASS
jgi:hypothetical protein